MLLFLLRSRIIYSFYLMFFRKPLDKTSKVWYNIYIKGKRITQETAKEKKC